VTASNPQISIPGPGGKPRLDRTLFVLIIIAVLVAGSVTILATVLYLGQSTTVTKNLTPFSTPPPTKNDPSNELLVANIDGNINVAGWSQPEILVNGTITARGLLANPNAVMITESTANGSIGYTANLPSQLPFFSPTYTVDLNVYIPSGTLGNVDIETYNGNIQAHSFTLPGFSSSVEFRVTNGQLSASNITSSEIAMTNTNGNVDFTCAATCPYSFVANTTNGGITATLPNLNYTGTYQMTTVNGGINLTVPATGSYKITVNTTIGSVSSSGLPVQLTNHVTSTIGAGTAIVTARTTNGSISVAGV
jgi:hypothetical protein